MVLIKITPILRLRIKHCSPLLLIEAERLHTSSHNSAWHNENKPKKFLKYNEKVYPPQSPEEEPRPAVSLHSIIGNSYYLHHFYFSLYVTKEQISSTVHGRCGT